MAFCEKCGAQLKEGAKFCAGCGAPVETYSQQPDPHPVSTTRAAQPAVSAIPAACAAQSAVSATDSSESAVSTSGSAQFLPET